MKKFAPLIPALVGALFLAAAPIANAATLSYNNFTGATGLQLNGSATIAGSGLQMTSSAPGQAGSAFSTNAVSLANGASFSTAFTFQMTNPSNPGADGIAFVVQTVSNTAGGAGGGMGYQGIANSLGVEFDTFNNGAADNNNSNHVAINTGGVLHNGATVPNTYADVTALGRMDNGNVWSAWVDYNSVTQLLEVRLAQGTNVVRPVAALLSYNVNLATVLGSTNAFVGFTGATGSFFQTQTINSWQFNSVYAPLASATVPTPATALLLGAGLIGMLGFRRKQGGLNA